jgi:hypothetical protein
MATTLPVNFSSGTLFASRTDANISVPTPVKFGVLQEGSIDIDGTLKELYGQLQFPQDVARGPIKITIKAKYAQIYSNYFDLFFGEGVAANTGLASPSGGEAHTIPTSSPYTITATNSANIVDDLGVVYSATGLPFSKSASASAAGIYSYSSGVYTFSSADDGAGVLLNYDYNITANAQEITINNQLMGTSPTFFMVLTTTYKGNIMNLKLNQCISSKLSIPVTNKDYTIFDFEAQAYANAAGVVGTLTSTS